jgi:hypothetical protein
MEDMRGKRVDEIINLSAIELNTLSHVAAREIEAAEAVAGPLSRLAQLELVRVDNGVLTFADAFQAVFQPLSTCRLNLLVMNDGGEPIEQYFIGINDSTAHLFGESDGSISFERLDNEQIARAAAQSLQQVLLGPARNGEVPDPEKFALACAALEIEGVEPLAWAGLILSRLPPPLGPGESSEPDDEWIQVVRCESGFLWQAAERGVLSFAQSDVDLIELVEQALADL